MEVIFLKPIFKNYIWGGTNLREKLQKESQEEKIAESWEISANENGNSIIKNGQFRGKTLNQIYTDSNIKIKEKIFGTKCINKKEFPLLVKFIDANQNLSVQVHPDDKFAKQYECSSGKSELWYVIDCEENANIICGLNNSKIDIKEIMKNNQIKKYLKVIKIKKGDCIYIPSGTIHALLSGTIVCEIQQNSNVTYRVYDWNRKDSSGNARELHVDKALKVIKPRNKVILKHTLNKKKQILSRNRFFSVDLINVENCYKDRTKKTTFYAYNVIEGRGILKSDNTEYTISAGESFIIPSNIGKYEILGKVKLLKSFI